MSSRHRNGSIEIPSDPQRIVACGYAVLPLIQAGANLAAVCEWTRELGNMDDKTKAAYEALPKVAPDGNVSQLNYEGIVAAEPDLIIMGVPARVESQLGHGAARGGRSRRLPGTDGSC